MQQRPQQKQVSFLNIHNKHLELHLIDRIKFFFLVAFEKSITFASCDRQNNKLN